MSLISLPNELLHLIFSYETISINDLKCMMISCRRLHNIIRASNDVWRQKFLTRWPHIPVQEEDKVQRLWLNWVSLRFKLGKAVRETVGTLSSKYYPDGKIAMNILDKWIEREYPTLLFVEDELRDLSFHQEKNENLTISYYALSVLLNLRRFIQLQKWQEYRAKLPSHESLYLEGALLISHWFQNTIDTEQYTGSSEIEFSLENIVQRVKQLLPENASLMTEFNDIDSSVRNAWMLLNVISQVMFKEMYFHVFRGEHSEIFLSIDEVLERREGCSTILCIIYYEVARRIGISCDPVYCGDRLLLKWRGNTKIVYFIDVCDGGTLKHQCLYPTMLDQPVASIEQILLKMVHELNESFRELIRTSDPEEESAEIYDLKSWLSDSVRLECAITPRRIHRIIEYAELCIADGMYLDEAIQLLQSVGREDDYPLIVRCKIVLTKHLQEINAAKIACRRVPSIKFAVGLVMIYKYDDPVNVGEMLRDTCVITSWNVRFKESNVFTIGKGVYNLDQPFYRILLDADAPGYDYSTSFGHFNVAEETLELHPVGVAIKHIELGNHFERFDGRKYIPNAEKRAHYPDDEAVAISIMG